MTTQDSFVVVTQLTYKPELRDQVINLMNNSMPIFRRQEGLISVTMHHHEHESKTMTYLVWESEADHERCMTSKDFAPVQSLWNELIQSGKAKFELDTYSVIDSYAAHVNTIF